MTAVHRRPVARALAIATEEKRRAALGVAFNCSVAALLLALLTVSIAWIY
ncbi:hypothetical protein SAMN05892877_115104 [Rhizobium subbaraonis]|uniref:Uncharacterized protein n=1 Tax=Rhizobium subbaraonis TaxID=908946 RepID=A0A285UU80_9HYPH|nr:hypothetical protein [Rhizobium subbaraonis]SOC45424.1 hypothetical protein SAMN05892877_115104 [Rhizobium subbaraonis]